MDVGEMQKKLRQWATEEPTKRFVDLYSLLCNPLWLRVAHQKVNANQGRETAGIDGQSMRDFNADLEGNLERLRQLLRAKTFEPLPVRRVYIPKSNGKKRPLGIPGIRDRIVQLGFYHLSSFRCSDLGCWVYYENTLPSPPRSEH